MPRSRKRPKPIVGPDAKYGDMKPEELLAIATDNSRALDERLECFSRVVGAKLDMPSTIALADAKRDLLRLIMANGGSCRVSGGMVYSAVANQDMTWNLKACLEW